jgi:hypothetical protein
MLKYLLKYDLKYIFKLIVVFYSLALFFGALARVFLSVENSLAMEIIGRICSGTAISMMFSILINTLMRLWVRFKQNFYGDESYLTHTLPVKKQTLYLSKIITSAVSVFVGVLVIAVTLFIAYYSKENIELLKNLILPLANIYESSVLKVILAFLVVFFLEFANILQAGLTGIILGHKMSSAKTGFSVLYGFLVYMATQVFSVVVLLIFGLFNDNFMNLFVTQNAIDIPTIKAVVWLSIAVYSICLIVIYFVNQHLFKKGVNVD